MRLIHKVPFTLQEQETYRQLVFSNVVLGMRAVLDAMDDLDIEVCDDNLVCLTPCVPYTILTDPCPSSKMQLCLIRIQT